MTTIKELKYNLKDMGYFDKDLKNKNKIDLCKIYNYYIFTFPDEICVKTIIELEILDELPFKTVKNLLEDTNEGDIIVSNPPFSKCKQILPKLKKLDKPFILILPSSKINTQYFKLFMNEIQLIIPSKRIQFVKDGNDLRNACNFDCFYYCYKMNLPRDIIWLE